ncbi:hypothetical protein CNO18_01590 [Gordonia sp. 1D]|nr:hypothetical protein CNO18_01590 [Gordonia sp. 1D]
MTTQIGATIVNVLHIFQRADLELAESTGVEVPAVCGAWVSTHRIRDEHWPDCPDCVAAARVWQVEQ